MRKDAVQTYLLSSRDLGKCNWDGTGSWWSCQQWCCRPRMTFRKTPSLPCASHPTPMTPTVLLCPCCLGWYLKTFSNAGALVHQTGTRCQESAASPALPVHTESQPPWGFTGSTDIRAPTWTPERTIWESSVVIILVSAHRLLGELFQMEWGFSTPSSYTWEWSHHGPWLTGQPWPSPSHPLEKPILLHDRDGMALLFLKATLNGQVRENLLWMLPKKNAF